ncbi:MAG: MarR family transcriptional regulator [Tildeniella nuda ZEHNDER 1965/U140]|jgi:DNA-binding MarR family transcriptional regulator|nr:MarR family transcriptional regulator [Tildeniella nuda ZEHNDER 1965/U140]
MLELRDFPSEETLKAFAKRFPELNMTALQTWLKLLRVSSDVVAYLENYLSDYGLSRSKFFVLLLLMRNPDGLNITQLAEGTGVSCATMTGLIDRLKKAELVTREELQQDRRVFVVQITSKGEQLMERVLPEHYRRVAALMHPLSERDRKSLQTLLEKVNSGLEM